MSPSDNRICDTKCLFWDEEDAIADLHEIDNKSCDATDEETIALTVSHDEESVPEESFAEESSHCESPKKKARVSWSHEQVALWALRRVLRKLLKEDSMLVIESDVSFGMIKMPHSEMSCKNKRSDTPNHIIRKMKEMKETEEKDGMIAVRCISNH